MDNRVGSDAELRVALSQEQIERRVTELARQISEDYRGRRLYAVCVMENGFVFMADLIRELDGPVVCQFIRPDFTEADSTTEIFFSPEPDAKEADVLLVEGLVDSGLTTEFLVRNLLARGAKSVKVAALLDRQSSRCVALQPDYVGFQVDEAYLVGYGLGSPQLGRNLPFVATVAPLGKAQPV